MAKKDKGGLPAGFTPVASSSFAPWHDWKKRPLLVGVVMEKRTIEQMRKEGRKMVRKETTILEVADSDSGEVSAVSESYATAGVIEQAKKGDEVFFRFEGVKKLKGGKKLREFTCGIKPARGKRK